MDKPAATELLKFYQTRLASKLLMLDRCRLLRQPLELLMVNAQYKALQGMGCCSKT
jgi:hypothetical protein